MSNESRILSSAAGNYNIPITIGSAVILQQFYQFSFPCLPVDIVILVVRIQATAADPLIIKDDPRALIGNDTTLTPLNFLRNLKNLFF
jgi:hypothetical protein